MTKLTTTLLRDIRTDIDAALKAVGEKYGVTLTTGKCTYADEHAKFQVNLATIGGDGNARTKQSDDYLRFASLRGWNPDLLFQQIKWGDRTMTVIGAYPRRKSPILVRAQDGAQYLLPDYVVRAKVDEQTARLRDALCK